jgi:hypothetical protein
MEGGLEDGDAEETMESVEVVKRRRRGRVSQGRD